MHFLIEYILLKTHFLLHTLPLTAEIPADVLSNIDVLLRFGTVLENVEFDQKTRIVNFEGISRTQNTRASYPISFIENAKIPCIGTHPKNIIFLTCDAFGILPPVSKLSVEQAMYHFISG